MTTLTIKARRCIEAGVSALVDPTLQATWRVWAQNHPASSHPAVIPCVVLDAALSGLEMRMRELEATLSAGGSSEAVRAELTYASTIQHHLTRARQEEMMEHPLPRLAARKRARSQHPRHLSSLA